MPKWPLIPIILVVLFYFIGHLNKDRSHIFPINLSKINATLDSDTDILIIGDINSILFNSHVESLINSISKNLNRPISIYNLGARNDNIFRTFKKLKSLEKLPPVVIYLGGSSEFYERLAPKNLKITSLNYSLFQNEIISASHTIFPQFKKYLFLPDQTIKLEEEAKKGDFKNLDIKKYLEIYFYSYERELKKMVSYIEKNNSTPILITPPINLLNAETSACPGSFNESINSRLKEIEEDVEKNKVKETLLKIKSLDAEAFSNAQVKYLYGKILYLNGKYSDAKAQLTLSKAYNCSPNSSHPVINSIIKNISLLRDVHFYDFNKELNLYFGHNELFLSDNEAQVIYYENLKKELIIILKDIFTL